MFWLFVIASIALSAYAIARRSWQWMLISGLFYAPMAWYLDATPRFNNVLLLLILYPASAFAAWRGKSVVAAALLTPIVALSAWVAWLVVVQ
ncbi:MAG: hypothetical protein AAB427_11530 [Chloroflexota bacterium]